SFYREFDLARILVASASDHSSSLTDTLSLEHEVLFVTCLKKALDIVSGQDLDLIMCNIQFDESRMFELLIKIKATCKRDVPFICYKENETRLSPDVDRNVAYAARALGATDYLDASKTAQINDSSLLNIIRNQLNNAVFYRRQMSERVLGNS